METRFVKMITCLLLAPSFTAMVVASDKEPLTVTSILDSPYLMYKQNHESLEGNARFKGYIVDLLNRLATKADFSYSIRLVGDHKYGSQLDNGQWNGMIREVMDSVADFAAAPLTVSESRRAAIDFTVPFMTFGSAIIMKKQLTEQNGTTQHPPLPTINSIRDLADQTEIKYGVIKSGRTADFFSKSDDPSYRLMWQEMSNNPDYGMVPYTEEGVRRVRQSDGRYAFITEGMSASYHVHRKPCDLVSVDGKMETRHYALAVRHGSELKAKLDEAIRQMESDGELDQLHHKWWVENSDCSGANSVAHTGLLMIAMITAVMAVASPLLHSSP